MTEVVGIKYDDLANLVYAIPERSYQKGDLVLVQQQKYKRLGKVIQPNCDIASKYLPDLEQMDCVFGLADQSDIQRYHENLQLAQNHFSAVNDLISRHGLKMKLVDIVFSLDNRYVLITFVAEHRVDFRLLLKDLAQLFRSRIELRQIHSREESKVYGGLGPCGRALCCSSFLGDFPPVSIKMAKNQNLSLNSGKTTGVCGRLMCCLSFEDDFYTEAKKRFPDIRDWVQTPDGRGRVLAIDVLAETVTVKVEEDRPALTYALEELSLNG